LQLYLHQEPFEKRQIAILGDILEGKKYLTPSQMQYFILDIRIVQSI